MGSSPSLRRRPPQLLHIFLLLLHLLLLLLGHPCEGSRPSPAAKNVFEIRPRHHGGHSSNIGHFYGFLPRGIPIPASGPSRKHNAIGLQSLASP
ncbi:hypothetical protein CDL15_Pgr017345 [Punica granatum]|uniref:Protein IDA-LIKE 2-like n=1 Tax=Punica granatum TaxID=22663 RepID=A0A218Y2A6_PUNGR|nr:hypothetical protein CDL15_Pgr017345 [Punica granatum]PKI45236.1 hypothetical protein CRG98_034363 [Punica granatum]